MDANVQGRDDLKPNNDEGGDDPKPKDQEEWRTKAWDRALAVMQRQDNLINNRRTSYFTLQGFLFTAMALAANPYATASSSRGKFFLSGLLFLAASAGAISSYRINAGLRSGLRHLRATDAWLFNMLETKDYPDYFALPEILARRSRYDPSRMFNQLSSASRVGLTVLKILPTYHESEDEDYVQLGLPEAMSKRLRHLVEYAGRPIIAPALRWVWMWVLIGIAGIIIHDLWKLPPKHEAYRFFGLEFVRISIEAGILCILIYLFESKRLKVKSDKMFAKRSPQTIPLDAVNALREKLREGSSKEEKSLPPFQPTDDPEKVVINVSHDELKAGLKAMNPSKAKREIRVAFQAAESRVGTEIESVTHWSSWATTVLILIVVVPLLPYWELIYGMIASLLS